MIYKNYKTSIYKNLVDIRDLFVLLSVFENADVGLVEACSVVKGNGGKLQSCFQCRLSLLQKLPHHAQWHNSHSSHVFMNSDYTLKQHTYQKRLRPNPRCQYFVLH